VAIAAGLTTMLSDLRVGLLLPALGVAVGCAVVVEVVTSAAIAGEQARGAKAPLLGSARTFLSNAVLLGGPAAAWIAASPSSRLGPLLVVLMTVALVASAGMHRPAAPETAVAESRTLARPVLQAAILGFVFYVVPGFATLVYVKQRDQLGFSLFTCGVLESLNNLSGLAGVFVFYRLRRRFPLAMTLPAAIVLYAIGSEAYLFYGGGWVAPVIEAINGFLATMGLAAMWETAVRGAGREGKAFSTAVILCASGIGNALSEVIGTWLVAVSGMSFSQIVLLHVACYGALAVAVSRLRGHLSWLHG
jgi:hypothetical protein